jgi:hypothetical protein
VPLLVGERTVERDLRDRRQRLQGVRGLDLRADGLRGLAVGTQRAVDRAALVEHREHCHLARAQIALLHQQRFALAPQPLGGMASQLVDDAVAVRNHHLGVGRAGIRRRKPVHHLPKSHAHYSDAELGRVFGQFRWSAYSPAGSVERAGFLARQWSRARRHPEWNEYNHKTKLVGAALLALVYLGVLLFATVSLGARMFGS